MLPASEAASRYCLARRQLLAGGEQLIRVARHRGCVARARQRGRAAPTAGPRPRAACSRARARTATRSRRLPPARAPGCDPRDVEERVQPDVVGLGVEALEAAHLRELQVLLQLGRNAERDRRLRLEVEVARVAGAARELDPLEEVVAVVGERAHDALAALQHRDDRHALGADPREVAGAALQEAVARRVEVEVRRVVRVHRRAVREKQRMQRVLARRGGGCRGRRSAARAPCAAPPRRAGIWKTSASGRASVSRSPATIRRSESVAA